MDGHNADNGGLAAHDAALDAALATLRAEGRYRVFADIRRDRGAFPRAIWRRGWA